MFEPEALYALPFNAVRGAPSLQSLLRGGGEPREGSDLMQDAGKIVDDTVDLSIAELDPEFAQPSVVFRVQHINPSNAKLLRCPTNMLRSDHVAIFPYNVDSRLWNTDRKLVVTSDFQRGEEAASFVLSLSSFLEMGFEKVMSSFVVMNTCDETMYSVPRKYVLACKASLADIRKVITVLVNAGAYAGAWAIFLLDPQGPERFKLTLEALRQHGVVVSLGENRFQISVFHSSVLQTCIVTEGASRVLDVRPHLALLDRSHHEMLQLLQDAGFKLKPFHGKRALPPLMLKDIKDEDKVCFFNKTHLDLSKVYVECLCSLDVLVSRGHEELLHRQPADYYEKLLGRIQKSQKRLCIVDDVADFSYKSRRVLALPGFDVIKPKHGGDGVCPAIEDGRPEGEPEEGEDLPKADSESAAKYFVDKAMTHMYGPFKFTYVSRQVKSGKNKGELTTSWQVTCRFHRNEGDPETTRCTKTLGFVGDDEKRQRVHELRAWCLAGRHCRVRRDPNVPRLGHQGCSLFVGFVVCMYISHVCHIYVCMSI